MGKILSGLQHTIAILCFWDSYDILQLFPRQNFIKAVNVCAVEQIL